MKKLLIFFILSIGLLATPDAFIKLSETFLGSDGNDYYTLLVEINNSGSYYINDQEIYLTVYNDKGLKSKKKLKKETVFINDAEFSYKHDIKSKNSEELGKLLDKNINFFTYITAENDDIENYTVKKDGIYKIDKDNEENMIISRDEIMKKLNEIYEGNKKNLISEDETFKVLIHYINGGFDYYLINADFDYFSANIIIKKTDSK